MFLKFYYHIKPAIPRYIQVGVRSRIMHRRRNTYKDVWPICEETGNPPAFWTGWPEKKRFALIITHDVEGMRGIKRCGALVDLEKSYGFKSSFNFVCEDYPLPYDTLAMLRNNGFEIGIHGLTHRGNPFRSRRTFSRQVTLINRYIRQLGAVGFRSPSMFHNLDWIGELDIEYDASTFDVDPFEPQPDGVHTIFPFMVSSPLRTSSYVELPYTMPQDSTLFVLMKEKTIDLWKKKLDWIAGKGGMALLITHPDYMNFGHKKNPIDEYPVGLYCELLEYLLSGHAGEFWNVLPKDVATFWRYQSESAKPEIRNLGHSMLRVAAKKKIWIDLDNTPHIPFFKPIIDELDKRGYESVVTARDAYQVLDMADRFGLKYEKIGHHYGKNTILKVAGSLKRGFELLPFILKHRPVLAVSHGSRTQLIAAHFSHIPSLMLYDYEYSKGLAAIRPTYTMMPEVLYASKTRHASEKTFSYPGIKEDVYVCSYTPDPSIKKDLGLNDRSVIVTVRPPATEAHYFNPLSEELFESAMSFLLVKDNIQLIVVPRNKRQENFIRQQWTVWCNNGKIVMPNHAVNGLDLIWYSDLVISGGGTMNREAAALGVPVYSIFRGTIGAVDAHLSQIGRLVLIEGKEDLKRKLVLTKRDNNGGVEQRNQAVLKSIVDTIVHITTGSR